MSGFLTELNHLLGLDTHTPTQLRRIAELAELHGDDDTARSYWHKAVLAGDELAIAMLTPEPPGDNCADIEARLHQTAAYLRRKGLT